MNWNIFSPVKNVPRRGKPKDRFDEHIHVIETFAPREHLSEREAFYYNYKMMASTGKSLLALLETLSQKKRLGTDPGEHARALFIHLKDFYDPKQTLSLAEALGDKNLMRRFRDLFFLFYGRKKIPREEMEGWLESLK